MTTWPHRLLMLIPAAQQAAINTWWAANVDLEGAGNQTFTTPLSADGNLPASHYWASTALTDAQIVAILRELATMAGISVPTAAGLATRAQKIAWITSNLAAIKSATGISFVRDDEDGSWTDPQAALTTLGIRAVVTASV